MIGAERDDLAERLTAAGVATTLFVPELIGTPCALLIPGNNYLIGPDTLTGAWTMTLNLYLLVELVDNEAATEDLDDLIATALPLLEDWEVTAMSQPGQFSTTAWTANGVVLTITNLTEVDTP
jgi:hypothetical protein